MSDSSLDRIARRVMGGGYAKLVEAVGAPDASRVVDLLQEALARSPDPDCRRDSTRALVQWVFLFKHGSLTCL